MPKNRTKNKFKKNKAILPKSDSQQPETQPKLVSKTVGGVTVEVPDNPRYIVRTIKNFEDLLDEAKKRKDWNYIHPRYIDFLKHLLPWDYQYLHDVYRHHRWDNVGKGRIIHDCHVANDCVVIFEEFRNKADNTVIFELQEIGTHSGLRICHKNTLSSDQYIDDTLKYVQYCLEHHIRIPLKTRQCLERYGYYITERRLVRKCYVRAMTE